MKGANRTVALKSSPVKRRHPFSKAFSSRCMRQDGFDRRTPPANGSQAKTLGELVNTLRAKLRHGQRWGHWRLDAHRLTLDYAPEGIWRYELDLQRNHDAASILDFIFQFHAKAWADSQTMKDLLDALYAIFDPQANLCACGVNRSIGPNKFLAGRIEPPTDTEREESYREAFEGNAAWLGSDLTDFIAGR